MESNSHERLRPDQGYKKEFSVLRDYSLDNKSQGRQSVNSQKVGPESDTDSMAEYGEGDTGKVPFSPSLNLPPHTHTLLL